VEGVSRHRRRSLRAPSIERCADQRGGRRRRQQTEGDEIETLAAAAHLSQSDTRAAGSAEMPGAPEALIELPRRAIDPDLDSLVLQADAAVEPQVASETQDLFNKSSAIELPKGQDGILATSRCEVKQNVTTTAAADVLEWSPIPQTSSEAPDSIGFASDGDRDGGRVQGVANDEGPTEAKAAAQTHADQPESATTADTRRAAEADTEQPSESTSAEVHAAEASTDAPETTEAQGEDAAETTSVALQEIDQHPADIFAVGEPGLVPHPQLDALVFAKSLDGAATEVPADVVE